MRKRLSYFGFAAIPAILCLTFICYFGVNVLFWDDWEIIVLAKKIQDSGLNFDDLFAQHNEHRILFPRILYLAVGYLSNFNSVAQMITSFVMLSFVAFMVTNYIARQKEVSDRKKYLFITLASLFIYSWMQWENLLWGFQVGFFMVLSFPIISFYFLDLLSHTEKRGRRNIYFTIALLATLIASFSSSQGLLSWFVGAILLFILFRKKTVTSPYFIIWVVMALFAWIAYFHNFVKTTHQSTVAYFFDNPVYFVQYFFSIIGNTVFTKLIIEFLVSIAGLLVVIFILITIAILWNNKYQFHQFLFPIALIMNGLIITAAIAMGRGGMYAGRIALPSRYTSFPIYIIVGLLLIWLVLKDKKDKTVIKKLTAGFIIALILSTALTSARGLYQGIVKKADDTYYAYILETAEIQPKDNLLYLYPNDTEMVLNCKDFLKENKYNVFHKPAYEIPPVLYDDHAGIVNNSVLQIDKEMFQLTADTMKVIAPIVTPDYEDKITNLYLDIDGAIYPLYNNNRHKLNPLIHRLKQYDKSRNQIPDTDASIIVLPSLMPGIHQMKIKALTVEGSYYIVNPDITFELE